MRSNIGGLCSGRPVQLIVFGDSGGNHPTHVNLVMTQAELTIDVLLAISGTRLSEWYLRIRHPSLPMES